MERKLKALAVDDEQSAVELIRGVLESAGLSVDGLTDSAQAGARLQMEKFDVVFLDLHMPPPDGLDLARKVRSSGLNRRTPIVLITADHAPEVLLEGFNAGATFFLFKPLDNQRLLRVMRAAEAVVVQEKRRFQRVAIERRILLSRPRFSQSVECRTLDLSLTGMLVQCAAPFPVGEEVEVRLHLTAGGPPLLTSGRVARVLEDGCIGIELVNVPAARQRLQEFLLPLLLESETGVADGVRRGIRRAAAPEAVS